MLISPYLSIWEIANRWQNYDPNKTESDNLPMEIQDSLRFLCRSVLRGALPLFDELFLTSDTQIGTNRFESFIYELEELPRAISACVMERKYDKKILDSLLVNRHDIFKLTVYENASFPNFWWDDSIVEALGGQITPAPEPESQALNQSSARTSTIHKALCQAVAKTLWEIYPDTNITKMTKHPSILKHGGGAYYPGKNTLRDWLREVAPEHIKNKPGRPKNTKPSSDAA